VLDFLCEKRAPPRLLFLPLPACLLQTPHPPPCSSSDDAIMPTRRHHEMHRIDAHTAGAPTAASKRRKGKHGDKGTGTGTLTGTCGAPLPALLSSFAASSPLASAAASSSSSWHWAPASSVLLPSPLACAKTSSLRVESMLVSQDSVASTHLFHVHAACLLGIARGSDGVGRRSLGRRRC